jgi:hypothetical protein
MACGPTVDQARPARGGSGAPRRGPLAGKGDPRRLPPTSEPRSGNRLVRGSPGGVRARDIPLYRRAVPGHRHGGTPARLVFKPRGRWWVPWTTRHHEADQSWYPEAGARPLGRWDSNPGSDSSARAGQCHERALTCGFSLPLVTAHARWEPGVPGPRGPSADHWSSGLQQIGLTSCLQSQFGQDRNLRRKDAGQVEAAGCCPWFTAGYRSRLL